MSETCRKNQGFCSRYVGVELEILIKTLLESCSLCEIKSFTAHISVSISILLTES